jgi:hypothetical protein
LPEVVLVALLAATAFAFLPDRCAADQIVTFELYNVVFSDGSTATGTFDYDFTTDSAHNVAITAAGVPFNSSGTDVSTTLLAGSYENEIANYGLNLTFATPLDPANGTTLSLGATSSYFSITVGDPALGGTVTTYPAVSGLVIPVASLPVTAATPSGPAGTNGWYQGPVTVALSATAGVRPIAATYYTLDGSAPLLYQGAFAVTGEARHTVSYWSVDSAGFVETAHYLAVNIDGTPPATTAYRSGETIYLSASDNLSGVAAIYYTVNGGTSQVYSGPIIAPVGTDTVVYWAADAAGNAEAAHTITFTTGDTVPPTPPGSPHWVVKTATGGTIAWTASTDNVGVAGYRVYYLLSRSGRGGGNTWVLVATTQATQIGVTSVRT